MKGGLLCNLLPLFKTLLHLKGQGNAAHELHLVAWRVLQWWSTARLPLVPGDA